MPLNRSIRRSASWILAGGSSGQVITFLFGIVLARLLVPADFGMLLTILIITGLAGFVAGGGMGEALVRAKSVQKSDYETVFTLQIIIGVIIYASLYFSAPLFARWYDEPIYSDLLRVSALSFIIRPFFNIPQSILHREMRFKAKAFVHVAVLMSSSFVSVSMAFFGYGVWSLLVGGLFGSVIGITLLIPLANWRPNICFDMKRARELGRYGFLVSISNILSYAYTQASIFGLSRTLGPTAVGLYNKADSLSQIPSSTIAKAVYEPLFRAIASYIDSRDKVKYLYLRAIKLSSVYMFPFYVLLAWIPDEIIFVLYGERWLEAATPMAILAAVGFFKCIANPAGAVLAALNYLEKKLVVQITSIAILIFALVIGLKYGIKGAAFAVVIAYVTSSIHVSIITARVVGVKLRMIFNSIIPAFYQSLILIIVLCLLDYAIVGANPSPVLSLLFYGTATIITFILTLAFSPFDDLRQEYIKLSGLLRAKIRPDN